MKKNGVVLGMVLLLLSACASSRPASGEEGKVLRMGTETFAPSLDSAHHEDGRFVLEYGIGETLLRRDENREVKPWLASVTNIDPYSWKLTLDSRVVFSSGSALTPEMVVRNLTRVSQRHKRAAYLLDANYEIEGRQITVTTKEMRPTLPDDLCEPYAVILDLDHTTDFVAHPIGTGPYRVESFKEAKQAVLLPNANYWNGEPKLDKVIITRVSGEEEFAARWQTGEWDVYDGVNPLDAVGLPPEEALLLRTQGIPHLFMLYYRFATVDALLREAVHLAIDKERIANELFPGIMTVPEKRGTDEYNLSVARSLLKEAGYQDSDGNGFLEKDGQEIRLKIAFRRRPGYEEYVAQLCRDLQKLGIATATQAYENDSYLSQEDYDLGLAVTSLSSAEEGVFLEELTGEQGSINYSGIRDYRIDDICRRLHSAFTKEERTDLIRELRQLLQENHYVEFLAYMKKIHASAAGVTNYPYLNVDTDID